MSLARIVVLAAMAASLGCDSSPTEPERLRISGTVRWMATQVVVAGAEVRVEVVDPFAIDPIPMEQTTTDAQGRYQLAFGTSQVNGLVTCDKLDISVTVDGQLLLSSPLDLLATQEQCETRAVTVDLELPDGTGSPAP